MESWICTVEVVGSIPGAVGFKNQIRGFDQVQNPDLTLVSITPGLLQIHSIISYVSIFNSYDIYLFIIVLNVFDFIYIILWYSCLLLHIWLCIVFSYYYIIYIHLMYITIGILTKYYLTQIGILTCIADCVILTKRGHKV